MASVDRGPAAVSVTPLTGAAVAAAAVAAGTAPAAAAAAGWCGRPLVLLLGAAWEAPGGAELSEVAASAGEDAADCSCCCLEYGRLGTRACKTQGQDHMTLGDKRSQNMVQNSTL